MSRPTTGYCEPHAAARQARQQARDRQGHRAYNARRPASDRFYSTARWQQLRNWFIQRYPLCAVCRQAGRLVPATVVDHIVPYKRRPDLGLDPANLRSLCSACHNRVGAKVRGGGGE